MIVLHTTNDMAGMQRIRTGSIYCGMDTSPDNSIYKGLLQGTVEVKTTQLGAGRTQWRRIYNSGQDQWRRIYNSGQDPMAKDI